MRLNRSHRAWAIISGVILIIAAVAYALSARTPRARIIGTSGGSIAGLIFGIAGAACMLYAALLGLRKRFRTWRLGPADFWLKSHLWLGILSLPLLWFHGGFRHGGPLTTLLMWLLYVVILSGIIGAFLQHVLPRLLWQRIQFETVFEQIPRVIASLVDEVEKLKAAAATATPTPIAKMVLVPSTPEDDTPITSAPAPVRVVEFIEADIEPFLHNPAIGVLVDRRLSAATFLRLHDDSPLIAQPIINRLEEICEERRQLVAQGRLHLALHLWMMLHVPPSVALLILGAFHAFAALRY